MKQQNMGSGINPANLQEVLDSATNAAAVGQSQYFTPREFGALCAIPLPETRTTVIDLTCGRGDLLFATANKTTKNLLGCDIENLQSHKEKEDTLSVTRIVADTFKLYELLHECDWMGDLFVCNFPWGQHIPKERLALVAESTDYDLANVRSALKQRDPMLGAHSIDSTIALMMLTLDRMSRRGEGMMIANMATLNRLLFAPSAPYSALAHHVWAVAVLSGNPMTGIKNSAWDKENTFKTGVIYFSKAHVVGHKIWIDAENMDEFRDAVTKKISRRLHQEGYNVQGEYHVCQETAPLWESVRDEWNYRQGERRKNSYNIWLASDGTIETNLSLFEDRSFKVDKQAAQKLHELRGQRPLQLVMLANQRQALVHAVKGGLWKVHPDLPAAVDKAILEYNAVRAPLYPLSPVCRLGFCDEEKFLTCTKDLKVNGGVAYKMGQRYELRTQTTHVERIKWKPNLVGGEDEFLLHGQELVIYLKDEAGIERSFVDSRIMKEGVQLDRNLRPEFNLQTIVDHFEIPDVPDVSVCHPEEYKANLAKVDEIQRLMNHGFKFKPLQREDLARAALHKGLILGWEPGIGKTLGSITLAHVWCGFEGEVGEIHIKEPVLFVVPGNLIPQWKKESKKKFGINLIDVDCQDTFLRLKSEGGGKLKPGYYVCSYTQLCQNKAKSGFDDYADYIRFSKANGIKPERPAYSFELTRKNWDGKVLSLGRTAISATMEPWNYRIGDEFNGKTIADIYKEVPDWLNDGIGKSVNGIRCVLLPTLAELCREDFTAVIVDEGVRIKSDDSLMGKGVRLLNPKYRLVLSATPIKNRLPDMFWLNWWACGGNVEPTARWPYSSEEDEKTNFESEFMVMERNLTKEKAMNNGRVLSSKVRGGRWRKGKVTAEVANIHRLWKLVSPILLRRRKKDFGSDIVDLIRRPLKVPMGKQQAAVYKYHLEAQYLDKNMKPAIGAKLQALRSVASAPHSSLLGRVMGKEGPFRSDCDYTPKIAAILQLTEQIIRSGKQAVIFASLLEPLDTIGRKLAEAGVPHDILDGRMNQARRGELSLAFQEGRPSAKPVLLACRAAMSEGNSWPLAGNVIHADYDWALDLNCQSDERVYRINSPEDVISHRLICSGSIERRMESMFHEKSDTAELVLDGKLIAEEIEEISLTKLLQIAEREFAECDTIDESELEAQWPALRAKLADAWRTSSTKKSGGLQRSIADMGLPGDAPRIPLIREARKVQAITVVRRALSMPVHKLSLVAA